MLQLDIANFSDIDPLIRFENHYLNLKGRLGDTPLSSIIFWEGISFELRVYYTFSVNRLWAQCTSLTKHFHFYVKVC